MSTGEAGRTMNLRSTLGLAKTIGCYGVLYLGGLASVYMEAARDRDSLAEFWAIFLLNSFKLWGGFLLLGAVALAIVVGFDQLRKVLQKRKPATIPTTERSWLSRHVERIALATGGAIVFPFWYCFVGILVWTCLVELGAATGVLSIDQLNKFSPGGVTKSVGGAFAGWTLTASAVVSIATWVVVYFGVAREQGSASLKLVGPVLPEAGVGGATLPTGIADAVRRAAKH